MLRRSLVSLPKSGKTTVTGVEMFNKILEDGQAGDNVGCLLRGVEKDDIERGQVICQARQHPASHPLPGTGLCPDQGRGRSTHTVLLRVQAPVLLPHHGHHWQAHAGLVGAEMCMPGDNIKIEVDLEGKGMAMEEGVRFAVREGGRTVGSGVVTKIVE